MHHCSNAMIALLQSLHCCFLFISQEKLLCWKFQRITSWRNGALNHSPLWLENGNGSWVDNVQMSVIITSVMYGWINCTGRCPFSSQHTIAPLMSWCKKLRRWWRWREWAPALHCSLSPGTLRSSPWGTRRLLNNPSLCFLVAHWPRGTSHI